MDHSKITKNDISIPLDLRLKDLMSKKVTCIKIDSTLSTAVQKFVKSAKTEALIVVDEDNQPLGALNQRNILAALADGFPLTEKINAFYNPNIWCLNENISLQELTKAILSSPYGFAIVMDDNNKIAGAITKVDSIMTFCQRSEALLEQLKGLYSALYNSVIVTDRHGKMVYMNKSAEAIFDVNSNYPFDLNLAKSAPSVSAVIHKAISEHRNFITEKVSIKDRTYYINTSCIYQEHHPIGTISILQEVADIESIAEELDSFKQLYTTLDTVLNVAYDGIVIVDRNGKVTFANDAFCKFTNRQRQAVLGRHITETLKDCKLHEVAIRGVPLKNVISKYGHDNYIISCLPIFKNDSSVGAVGKIFFKNFHELKELSDKVEVMNSKISYYERELKKHKPYSKIISQNNKMLEIIKHTKKVAKSDSTVIFCGESGTGKDLFAQFLHANSSRAQFPFIAVNCAALPENLLESELFGYDEGAFTGAKKQGKPGKFELANKGTLFLDEIGDMSPMLQAKLLRVLQDKKIERLGGISLKEVDVRIVAATNHDLRQLMESGKFREDLYYRINVINIHLPPLRERTEDIPVLVEKFINEYNDILNKQIEDITPEALYALMQYNWPGNVRELKHALERAINYADVMVVELKDFPEYIRYGTSRQYRIPDGLNNSVLKEQKMKTEEETITEALNANKWNKTQAAKYLGISRACLYQKIKKYNIT